MRHQQNVKSGSKLASNKHTKQRVQRYKPALFSGAPVIGAAILLSQLVFIPYVYSAPVGGNVVGGAGHIHQSGLHTTVNQNSQRMAIDWQSYNLGINEHVHYIQPNSSSISLNRILSNNASTIRGRIDANGQVILVNPNGVFFTATSVINVGGIIAAGLDIKPTDFMNGNYIFNEVMGTEGKVVNNGIINASVGGNVALIGKQVQNDGLIVAKLGSVTMAAGKAAVLTFDNSGLVGVKITKAILQNELGVDPAVLNKGVISAEAGRVLLTASVSQDIFSLAVNTNGITQAKSVVVNNDGTFTLGAGADVVNSGTVDVSAGVSTTGSKQSGGQAVLLGENVTSSGVIKADAANGNGGDIELHAANKTLLTQNSTTTARSESNGTGGIVKVLGDKVGLFDKASVDVSGANGGGTALIGGDQEGKNNQVRNANFTYLGKQSQVKADALDNGKGGKLITFAKDTARIHGKLFARGGVNGGDGGFIETSGLKGFRITSAPDASAYVGKNGIWLIDPYNITISANTTNNINTDGNFSFFDAITTGAVIDVLNIQTGLGNGDVIIRTTRSSGSPSGTESGDIAFNASLNYNGKGNNKLTLDADRNITFQSNRSISAGTIPTTDSLTLELIAGGDITLNNGVSIQTQDGDFIVSTNRNANNFDSSGASINVGLGSIDLNGVTGTATLGNLTATDTTNSNLDITRASSISQATGTTIVIGNRTRLGRSNGTTSTITLNEATNDFKDIRLRGNTATIRDANTVKLEGGTNLAANLNVTAGTNITDNSGIFVGGIASFNAGGNVILDNNNNFNNVNVQSAGTTTTPATVTIRDGTGGFAFSANNGLNTGGITGTLSLISTNGDITSNGEVNVSGVATFSVNDGSSILLGDSNNTFGSTVDFVTNGTGSPQINNITFTDDTALALPEIIINGNLNVTGDSLVFGHTDVNTGGGGGTFTATTTNASGLGTILQDATHITVNGSATTTLNATGDITLTSSNNDFQAVTITNGNIVSIRDTDSIRLLGSNTSGNLTITANNNILLAGNITTRASALNATAGNVLLTGNTFLSSDVNISTNATTTSGNVTFNNNVNNDNSGTGYNLDVTAGTGTVWFKGDIGNSTTSIKGLTVNSAGSAIVNNINTEDSGVSITATGIDLNGNIDTTGVSNAGAVSLAGIITLNGDTVINTNGTGADGNVTFNGAVASRTASRQLIVDADTANVDFLGLTGGATNTTALSGLLVTGSTVSLATTNTKSNGITINANTINLAGDLNATIDATAAGNVSLNGNVVLNSNVNINTNVTGTDADVLVTGTINADAGNNNRQLNITSGTRNVDIIGNVGEGTNSALGGLSIINTGIINVASVLTRGGGIILNSGTGTVNLGGNLQTIDDNVATGSVTIDGSTINLLSNVLINTDGAVNDGSITIGVTTDPTSISGNNNRLDIAAGTGTVNIVPAVSNLSAFDLQSSGTATLNGVSTNMGGSLAINANNGLTLNGVYDSNDGLMQINADADSISNGILTLGAGSTYTAQNEISFTASQLISGTGVTIDSGTNRTIFAGTNNALVGDYTTILNGYMQLSNAFVNSITASSVRVSAGAGRILYSLNANIAQNMDLVSDNVYFLRNSNYTSLDTTGTTNIRFSSFQNIAPSITTTNQLNLAAQNINVGEAVTVNSTAGDVTVSGNVSGSGQLTLAAITGTVDLQNAVVSNLSGLSIDADLVNLSAAGSTNTISTTNNINLLVHSTNPVTIDGNLSSNQVSVRATNSNLVMDSAVTFTGQNGVSLTSDTGSITVSQIQSSNGTINLTANNGNVIDGNGATLNLASNSVVIDALTGIDVDTQTSNLAITNNNGTVDINNTGNVTVSNMSNGTGNMTLANNGNVTVDKIDAGYGNSNPNSGGILNLNVTNGSVTAINGIPDITARSASIIVSGTFGTTRPVYLRVRDSLFIRAGVSNYDFYGSKPTNIIDNSTLKLSIFDAVNTLSGQQLIEVESLGDVDPAIFTAVRNYNQDDIAIKMPQDQIYEN